MGAGLVALVVFVDPDFAHLPLVQGLAIVIAASVVLAVILPIDWDRVPRLTMTVPLVAALALGWGGVLSPTSLSFWVAVGAGAVIIVAIYALPWDRFPRWVHNLPIFGAIAAIFIFQAAAPMPSGTETSPLLLFPLVLTTVLFVALYHSRNELLFAAGLASVGLIVTALLKRNQTGELGTALLVTVVLWVVVVTVHEVVRQLDLSHARLQAVIDNSLNAIVTMDAKGLVTGWNPQAEATFGWRANEIIGKAMADTVIPPQYRDAHRKGLTRYLSTGEGPVLGKVLDLTALHKSGREFPVEVSISPAPTPGEEVMFVGFLRDVSARKKADEAIQVLNDQLRVANQHKSEFLANMSHELRTPLNAILGFSDLLVDDVNEKFDGTARRRFLGQINSSGRHLLALINDILDLSKVEAGQMVLRMENVVVADVVREVINTIEPLASKKSIHLESHVDGAGQVPADAGKLKQMLLNLASNAIKFTNEGGHVTISASRLADVLDFSVSDTGIGIAAADQGHLFEEGRGASRRP